MATEKSWILLPQLKQLFHGHYTGQPQPLSPSTPSRKFHWSKVLLSTRPCWWQQQHLD